MRKLFLGLAAVAALGIAMPLTTSPASAETVVIKSGKRHHVDRGHHRKVVVIKRHRDRGLHRGWHKHRAEGRVIIRGN